jgi:superfamily II DNA or RNA helicase
MTAPTPEGLRAYWDRVGWKGTWSAEDDRVSRFYVPLLSRSVAYDRMAGYFTSSALTLAAAGLRHFLAGNGVMRLIVGAQLDPRDVRAIEGGEPLDEAVARVLLGSDAMAEATEVVSEHRRNVLGWMAKEGRLQVKIGVPLDASGAPLAAKDTTRYFHSKYGIFTDHGDPADRVAFIGSDNETHQGWVGNHETFAAFPTWLSEVWEWNGADLVAKFDAHWTDRPDEGWRVLDLHEAVREKLVEWAVGEAPLLTPDPEEEDPTIHGIAFGGFPPVEPDSRLVALMDAPRKDGGTGVGLVTAGVEPLPHQMSLARRVVESWPRGYLLADEVGLGKTIEAGFVIRELLLSGQAERFLLLVPAAVLRQWQEELAEKIGLRVNRFENGEFYDPDNCPVPASAWQAKTPWAAFPIVLASSHLARRRDHQREVVASGPWDLVLVDEAHHARRQGSKPTGTPNHLLSLLQDLRQADAWKALVLATATPMQMQAHEAWDLIELLGLPGRWASSAADFIRYFDEIRHDFDKRQWAFVSSMAKDHFADPAASPDPVLERKVKDLGRVKARRVASVSKDGLTQSQAKALDADLCPWVDTWLLTNNPMRDRVFRSTRTTLRAYRDAGMLPPEAVIPDRDVDDRFIEMTVDERELYDRIRTYIRRSYNRYKKGTRAQQALGFIMTVYRRRLTSSFQAIRLSLERRLAVLEGKRTANELITEDDYTADPTLPLEELEKTPTEELEAEIFELRDFIAALRDLPPDESKMACLHRLIDESLKAGQDTVLVFTQYADTMNYLMDQLSTAYGSRVMCHSGGGGRRLNAATGEWETLTKKETKTLFREGREVNILIGTDSLSEGLNLQTCGRLVNYDMPWNFMRVEQRIGRVDRIGGQPRVEVTNLFYKDTIEEQIYRGIAEDHGGFSWIVGPAQPVLGAVEDAIQQHELATDEDSPASLMGDKSIEQIIKELRIDIEKAQAQAVTLADFEDADADPHASDLDPAATLTDIEETLLAVPTTRDQLWKHPDIEGAWFVQDEQSNKIAVTFSREVLAAYSPEIRLLTFGDPLFDLMLSRAGVQPVARG